MRRGELQPSRAGPRSRLYISVSQHSLFALQPSFLTAFLSVLANYGSQEIIFQKIDLNRHVCYRPRHCSRQQLFQGRSIQHAYT